MKARRESASFRSLGDELVGTFSLPNTNGPSPALILCHGTGDFRENYFEMSRGMNQPVNPDLYLPVMINCEFVKDYAKALYYLDLYAATVDLNDEGKKKADGLRAEWTSELRRAEEEKLREELTAKPQ